MRLASTVATKLGGGGGPPQIMLWVDGAFARCVRGAFTRQAGRAALRQVQPDASPLWLSEWPEGVEAQGGGVTFGCWQTGAAATSVINEALSVVSTAKGMAETSAVELTQRLSALEKTGQRQSLAVRELADIFDHTSRSASLSTSLSSLFGALNDLQSNLVAEQNNHHRLVGEAAGTVTQLGQLSATISHFATSSRLATFNARLEAARLGEAGSGFLSIAGALFDLAQQVTAASASTTTLTQKLAKLLPQLSTSSQQLKNQLDAEMSALGVRVTELKLQLSESERLARGKLESARRDGEALTGEMNAAMAELQSTDRLSQLLSAMHEAFVRAQAGQGAAFSEFEARKDSLVSDQVLASAGSIELF
ncbi:MAG: hypothetical protein GQE15_11595 [Archangiaceae bacterium]|nr:hypothetical protein [Archangiaceae bacterium]